MKAQIYRPAKTAMQSGQAKTRIWRLEFGAQSPQRIDALMGWSGSPDTKQQVSLTFESQEAAVAYCEKHGIDFRIVEPQDRKLRIKSYADNFAYHRVR